MHRIATVAERILEIIGASLAIIVIFSVMIFVGILDWIWNYGISKDS